MITRFNILDLFVGMLTIGWGIDLSVSGIWILINRKVTNWKPKLLGLRIIFWVQSEMEKWQGDNKFVIFLYGLKTMAIYFLIAGMIFTAIGFLLLVEMFIQF